MITKIEWTWPDGRKIEIEASNPLFSAYCSIAYMQIKLMGIKVRTLSSDGRAADS